MKTIKFYTLGCKVNQYDTQSIREKFLARGFKEIDTKSKADFYLINTCTVTGRSDADSLNLIRRAKRENPQAKIIVTGCLAELDSARIKKIGGISLVVKNKDKAQIANLLSTGARVEKKESISAFKGHTRAFLKIQDGCDNFCAYCKVPLVRGRSKSRPLSEVVDDANRLVKNGFKEIVLCGICLGAYGKDLTPRTNLVELISVLENIVGLWRIRLSSIEAGDVSNELINKMRSSKKLCRHLHIPIQSGDDGILKKMRRRYCHDDYLRLIRKIKKLIPGVAITTDVLVGFPQESESCFNRTVALVKKIQPLKVHIFPYSKREGTLAARSQQEISQAKIKERILRLKSIAQLCSQSYKKQFLHKHMTMLVEGRIQDDLSSWGGYTDNYLKVVIHSKQDLKNHLISVQLKKIAQDSILADLY